MPSAAKVTVIDYGLGNLGSVYRALEQCGATVRVATEPAEIADADRIVLPGVGAFADAMKHLREKGWPLAIQESLAKPAVALLGICLGMQLVADRGFEGGDTRGIGLIPGDVRRLTGCATERLPHIGWNEIRIERTDPLLAGIEDQTDFYFVHSYHLIAGNAEDVIASTPYCGGFVSVIRSGNVFGTQFHPEKSSRAGFQLLHNFLSRSVVDA